MTTPTKIGAEFLVNTYTTSEQTISDITVLADGSYVIAWQSLGQDATNSWGVYAQRFNADGTKAGSEFLINTTTAGQQQFPAMTALANGGYAAVWQGIDTDFQGNYARIYDANGVAQTSEFLINATTIGTQYQPVLSALNSGGFVATWTSNDGNIDGITARIFNSAGVAMTAEFQVNTSISGAQNVSSVTTLTNGDFAVTWQSTGGQDGSGGGIFGQRFTSTGVAIGSEFQINTHTPNDQLDATVEALTGGGFVVTWSSNLQDGSAFGTYGQVFNAGGVALGSEFQVATATGGDQTQSDIAALQDGGFVVTWSSADASGFGTFGQRFDANGTKAGAEFQVNTYTNNNQIFGGVATAADGGFIVTWSSVGQDGSSGGIYAQKFVYVDIDFTNNADIATLYGGGQTVTGLGGNDTITGSIGDDNISGGQDDDNLNGRDGTDILRGQDGRDNISGGAGNDTLYGNDNLDTIDGGDGIDIIFGGTGGDIIDGGNDSDTIRGGVGADTIRGGDGNDTVFGDGQNDFIHGGLGDDNLNGGGLNDTIYGEAGADTLNGNIGDDYLDGGGLADILNGNGGNDTLIGGTGNDTLIGEGGIDTIDGGMANDTISGGAAGDIIDGGDGNDIINGDGGADLITGGSGNDMLTGGGALDTFIFMDNFGQDVITDFRNNLEDIDFSGHSGFNNIGDVMAAATQIGADVVIQLNAVNQLTIEDFALAQLDASDFIF